MITTYTHPWYYRFLPRSLKAESNNLQVRSVRARWAIQEYSEFSKEVQAQVDNNHFAKQLRYMGVAEDRKK